MHRPKQRAGTTRTVALIGQPNVGKSVLFHRLTGRYVTVANYPGTTVEVARGEASELPGAVVLDTPGVLTLPARTEDEQATAGILLREALAGIVQVGDAKNLRRTLQLTLFLAETGIPLVLALNMMDEAKARSVALDPARLSSELGIPVIPTIATRNHGISDLARAIFHAKAPAYRLNYPDEIERAVDDLAPLLPAGSLSPRARALLFLAGDRTTEMCLAEQEGADLDALAAIRESVQQSFVDPLPEVLQRVRLEQADVIVDRVLRDKGRLGNGLAARAGQLAVHPWLGWPVLVAVLYGLYVFVGEFGARILVDLLEKNLFGEIVNPRMQQLVRQFVPVGWIADFLVGEYGLWTMGMTYALALILPIVTTFFVAFGVLEDSGYFSRLSVLSNRLFRFLGLNGRSVLPMVLGLGCVTMATLTTRILHTPRERLIVTFLLALAIPCSAQLGVVMGMLAGYGFGAFLVWLGVVLSVLIAVGWITARLVPGKRIPLMTELPPMRMPVIGNVAKKTWARLTWYLKEVIPLFLLGAGLMFALDRAGVLPWLTRAAEPLVTGWLGLPREASAAFLMGFMRRDFGATGLFALGGGLTPLQGVVGLVTLTLFVPCLASVLMIAKEQGVRAAALMLVLIVPLAFLVGGLLFRGLTLFGWGA